MDKYRLNEVIKNHLNKPRHTILNVQIHCKKNLYGVD